MSTLSCGNCGAPSRPPFLAPPPELAPDLDGRPGEPARSTLHRWVATCPSCGAAAPDLSALHPTKVPSTGAYRDEHDTFLRWAMIAADAGDARGAAEAALQAAWMADDAGETGRAVALRDRAADLWGIPADPADALRLLDVLRRAGRFADAEALITRMRQDNPDPEDDQTAAILAFQQARVAARDDTRQMLSSALRPPARRPHVSHVQAKTRGFWSRLLGR